MSLHNQGTPAGVVFPHPWRSRKQEAEVLRKPSNRVNATAASDKRMQWTVSSLMAEEVAI